MLIVCLPFIPEGERCSNGGLYYRKVCPVVIPGIFFRQNQMSPFEKLAIVICFMAIAAALIFYRLHHP